MMELYDKKQKLYMSHMTHIISLINNMTMSIIVMQDYNKSHRARVTSGPSTTPIVGRVMVKTVETH